MHFKEVKTREIESGMMIGRDLEKSTEFQFGRSKNFYKWMVVVVAQCECSKCGLYS